MLIERIQDLPDVAQRSFWAKALKANVTTFYRAEKSGQLRRVSTNGRNACYLKSDILKWLNLTAEK